jgi:hypothetical protein
MKSSLSKTQASKKRSCEETGDVRQSSSRPVPPNPMKEWKKAKLKTEDILTLVNSGFLWEKEVDMWSAATGDAYLMETNPDEVPMFSRFVEHGLALPASEFFKGMLHYYGIEYVNLNLNDIFHTSIFIHFCKSLMGIKPVARGGGGLADGVRPSLCGAAHPDRCIDLADTRSGLAGEGLLVARLVGMHRGKIFF